MCAGVGSPLDNDQQSNGNKQPAAPPQSRPSTGAPAAAGGEVKLRDRRRRESAPLLGMPDLEQAPPGGSHNQQIRGARRVSRGSQRAVLTSCLSEDSALEGLDAIGDIQTPKGSRRNFIELMMSSSPQVGGSAPPGKQKRVFGGVTVKSLNHSCCSVFCRFGGLC